MPTGVYTRTEWHREMRRGRKLSEEHKRNIGLSHLGKKIGSLSEEHKKKLSLAKLLNPVRYWTGKHRDEATKHKLRQATLKQLEKGHPGWKGDDVGYDALHGWIRRHMPKPDNCEFCHEVKKLDAACITYIYNRDFNNWKYICRLCHIRYDIKRKRRCKNKLNM